MIAELNFLITNQTSRPYPPAKITGDDYAGDLAVLADHLKDGKSLFHNIEMIAKGIEVYVNAGKIELICLNRDTSSGMESINGEKIKQVNDFKYLGSYITATEHDVKSRLGKACGKNYFIVLVFNLSRNIA